MEESADTLAGHPDRARWNARYAGHAATSAPHPLAAQALGMSLPDGPVADLACGLSGTALLAASQGRHVTAVDVSEVALRLLGEEAERRGLSAMIALAHGDLAAWRPAPGGYALVICTGFWDRAVFAVAVAAVRPGGLLAWEAFTEQARADRPGLPAEWCLGAGEPASLLPDGYHVLEQRDTANEGWGAKRRLLARAGRGTGLDKHHSARNSIPGPWSASGRPSSLPLPTPIGDD